MPILVGALNASNEAMYGKLLAKYVDDPTNFFSVSSDFCHWGSRYVYLTGNFIDQIFDSLHDYHLLVLEPFIFSASSFGLEQRVTIA